MSTFSLRRTGRAQAFNWESRLHSPDDIFSQISYFISKLMNILGSDCIQFFKFLITFLKRQTNLKSICLVFLYL